MPPASQLGERAPAATFHRWYSAGWVLFGLAPPAIGVADEPTPTRLLAWAVVVALGLCYASLRGRAERPAVRPRAFLTVLVAGMGVLSALLGGGAALFVVSLPLFWIHTRGSRAPVLWSGAAAVVSVVAGLPREQWDPEFFGGDLTITAFGYAAGVGLGLWARRVLEQGEARAHRLGTELQDAQRELVRAHQRRGAAEERERMAREIHDTLAQGFASIVVLAEAARENVAADPAKSLRQLESIERTARENLAEARVLVGSAPREGIAPGSVARTLRRALDRFAQDTGIAVDAELPDLACDQPTRIALLRCAQESLANVRKHAAATHVGVVLTGGDGCVELEITDDGRGFVVARASGFGLDGMARRLAELGGELTVTSAPGEGTRVLAALPVREGAAA
ncbi:sensor histidine kinase [Streptomyces albus subsp. chlorinus]|uniref:sensor histidine kinase n=1 Tax=Streptomyces albus TaxID=1888 RepID=UPI00156E37C7|nr:sensor histidine kinase [Streptomyces albus]NSC20181.1 sensor histidine kinase [Streptomyces albus subsp. chlorinus]